MPLQKPSELLTRSYMHASVSHDLGFHRTPNHSVELNELNVIFIKND